MLYRILILFENLFMAGRVLYNRIKLKSAGVVAGKNVRIQGKLNLILRGNSENIVIGNDFLCKGDLEFYIRENGQIKLADSIQMDGEVHLTAANNAVLSIGRGTRICTHFTVNAGESVTIGRNCLIPDFCHINASDHKIDIGEPFLKQGYVHAPVTIGDDVMFGAFTCIKRGAEVEDGVVMGYHSVVAGKIEKNTIVAGIPAKMIKKRSGGTTDDG